MLKMPLPYAVKFMPNIQAAITAKQTISVMVTTRRAPHLAPRSVHMTSTAHSAAAEMPVIAPML